jgi:2-keto-4-pentenoate hydratase/2-oxohepta-3-ene-1,7-dioic acid hydratase in catechol pathway
LKLVTFKIHTEKRLGALVGDAVVVDLSSAYAQYLKEEKGREDNAKRLASALIPPSMKGFLEGGAESHTAALETLEWLTGKPKDAVGLDEESLFLSRGQVKLCAPVPLPGKIYCLAVNYYDHSTERIKDPEARRKEVERLKALNMDVPITFQKPPTLVVGPQDPVVKPRNTERMDYECELGIVIGKKGKYIPKDKACDHIAGYTVFIDVSYRDQDFPQNVDYSMYKRDINWTKGKGMDNSAPMGPCLLTADEVPDPYNPPLRLVTRVNGEIRQDGDVTNMIIKIPRIVEYLSNGTTLMPGDVIATGTVAGVAGSWGPTGYLSVGDTLECEIQPIGVMRHKVIAD